MTPRELQSLKAQTEQEIQSAVQKALTKFVGLSGGFQINYVRVELVTANNLDGSRQHFVGNVLVDLDL